jgi:hypothetical protein
MTRIHTTGHDDFIMTRNRSGLSREWVSGSLRPMDEDESVFSRFSRRFAWFAIGCFGVIAIYHVARAIGAML